MRTCPKCKGTGEVPDLKPRNNPGGLNGHQLNSAKTHCPRGHLLSGENLYTYKGLRHCRTCRRIRNRKHMRKVRSADG